jgi:predicted dehydrogenase
LLKEEKMERLRIGVLSHAHGHVNTYCGVMAGWDDVELAATWDDNRSRGQRAAERYGLQLRDSVSAVVEDPRIDAVMIGSETNRHADLVEAAASADKAILLQKPMATTLADCDRIIAAVEQHRVKFSMAFQMRHDPVNAKMKDLFDSGLVGRPAIVRRRHCINVLLNPAFAEGDSAWHVDPEANIGMFFDDATHAADWFFWMLGRPLSVMAEIDRIVTDVAPDDNGLAVYRFADGIIGVLLNSSTTVAAIGTTEIYGDEGTILQDYGDSPATTAPRPVDAVPLRSIRRGDDKWVEYPLAIPGSQGERIAAVPRPFVDYLRGDGAAPVSAQEGRVSVEMVLGAYRSATEGRRVGFPLA